MVKQSSDMLAVEKYVWFVPKMCVRTSERWMMFGCGGNIYRWLLGAYVAIVCGSNEACRVV